MTARGAGRRFRTICVALALIAAVGCDFPRDANGMLDRIRAEHVVRVGYAPRPPWVIEANGELTGIEPRLVRSWADSLGARVEWVSGSESTLIEALRARRIDLVIGGHLQATPWSTRVAMTQPYVDADLVIAVPQQHAPLEREKDLRGRIVEYVAGRPDVAAAIAEAEARPQPVPEPRGGIAAVYAFQATARGLTPTTIVLARERHVMLVAQGESALLFALDRFLLRPSQRAAARSAPAS